jgi:hypothetical protein
VNGWSRGNPFPGRVLARCACLAAWLVLVVWGFRSLTVYEFTVSESVPTSDWPRQTHLYADPFRATLVLFAHPQCPCTRATLSELARLGARLRDRLVIHVVFVSPSGQPDEWVYSDLWTTAKSIPGVQVLRDYAGDEARGFGATTSGQAFLFDPHGRLRYRGGITASRGHEGDNLGKSNIIAIVDDASTQQTPILAPAFGCALQARNQTTSRTITP